MDKPFLLKFVIGLTFFVILSCEKEGVRLKESEKSSAFRGGGYFSEVDVKQKSGLLIFNCIEDFNLADKLMEELDSSSSSIDDSLVHDFMSEKEFEGHLNFSSYRSKIESQQNNYELNLGHNFDFNTSPEGESLIFDDFLGAKLNYDRMVIINDVLIKYLGDGAYIQVFYPTTIQLSRLKGIESLNDGINLGNNVISKSPGIPNNGNILVKGTGNQNEYYLIPPYLLACEYSWKLDHETFERSEHVPIVDMSSRTDLSGEVTFKLNGETYNYRFKYEKALGECPSDSITFAVTKGEGCTKVGFEWNAPLHRVTSDAFHYVTILDFGDGENKVWYGNDSAVSNLPVYDYSSEPTKDPTISYVFTKSTIGPVQYNPLILPTLVSLVDSITGGYGESSEFCVIKNKIDMESLPIDFSSDCCLNQDGTWKSHVNYTRSNDVGKYHLRVGGKIYVKNDLRLRVVAKVLSYESNSTNRERQYLRLGFSGVFYTPSVDGNGLCVDGTGVKSYFLPSTEIAKRRRRRFAKNLSISMLNLGATAEVSLFALKESISFIGAGWGKKARVNGSPKNWAMDSRGAVETSKNNADIIIASQHLGPIIVNP